MHVLHQNYEYAAAILDPEVHMSTCGYSNHSYVLHTCCKQCNYRLPAYANHGYMSHHISYICRLHTYEKYITIPGLALPARYTPHKYARPYSDLYSMYAPLLQPPYSHPGIYRRLCTSAHVCRCPDPSSHWYYSCVHDSAGMTPKRSAPSA